MVKITTEAVEYELFETETYSIKTGCGEMFVSIHFMGDGVSMITASLGKAGSCPSAHLNTICDMASKLISCGVPLDEVRRMMSGVSCPNSIISNGEEVKSCIDGIAKILGRI